MCEQVNPECLRIPRDAIQDLANTLNEHKYASEQDLLFTRTMARDCKSYIFQQIGEIFPSLIGRFGYIERFHPHSGGLFLFYVEDERPDGVTPEEHTNYEYLRWKDFFDNRLDGEGLYIR